ncbi:DUF1840 domain-containing protein [Thauera chlorobenzoica]|uniref:Uncharacterized protein n=1 Tax=Thauera chlorobenzoica TaxID=96773 RepID=A0A1H5WN38_9RHOO|nr:DUF1840 domain-containing protein [Thauera chlorobenzoica]APR04364.1 hypothetical protein Tchl_1505 [Thauera chlorobenzoica]SEG00397.1 protein of unknown function [Thauera chlorobenzoica]
MLVTFKSAASADVIMFGAVAQTLLGILGKTSDEGSGIITVTQLPEAITRLKKAIEEDRARQAERPHDEDADAGAEENEAGRSAMVAPVGLAQRAWPLLNMLEASLRENVPVVWGT